MAKLFKSVRGRASDKIVNQTPPPPEPSPMPSKLSKSLSPPSTVSKTESADVERSPPPPVRRRVQERNDDANANANASSGNPDCRKCGAQTNRLVTRTTRSNNQGRPFFKCFDCGEFNGFADEGLRQILFCDCAGDIPAKLKSAGRNAQIPGSLYYSCGARVKRCDFWRRCQGPDSTVFTFDEDVIEKLKKLDILDK